MTENSAETSEIPVPQAAVETAEPAVQPAAAAAAETPVQQEDPAQAQEKFKTMIGGQALIEGIMMRGPFKQAVVVRSPDGLVRNVTDLKLIKDKYPVLGLPFIRGVVNFGSSMVNGVKALMFSADYFPEEEDLEPSKFELWIEKKFGSAALEQFVIYSAAILGCLFSVGLFLLLPTFLVGLIRPVRNMYVLRNLLEGCVKIAILVGYMAGVSRMSDMRRVFSYHGAEHKTIRCYEARLPLTVENCRVQTRLHPRCGTSFLFVVVFISILVGAFIPVSNTLLRMLIHLCLLPIVVGISYEFNRLVGRYDNRLTRILTKPGMSLQYFTTQEPDDSMLEVAIEALKLVIPDQEGADAW